ncbi:AAA family ATPase [Phenylobacterium sp. 58.2.17]|uniref:AAA family ATPase n=1 Tax=Phenylobacterium sp. 58.2.17 TaxID=2969306 RepID=UPI002263B61C|nr:AAA family ATPase [Phenylobacterium sp. 58.2.17]MCX7584915.1 AAA family ATPase [Phenylobacterium sp. 58.2.17]
MQWSQVGRLERHYGDLDAAYDADRFATILGTLRYSKDDEREGRANPSKLEINGDVYANLAGYRATLSYYSRFREAEAGEGRQDIRRDELERMKTEFLAQYPDFEAKGFGAREGAYWQDERASKEAVVRRFAELIEQPDLSDDVLGDEALALLQQLDGNPVGWRAFTQIKDAGEAGAKDISIAVGTLLRDPEDPWTAAATCAAAIHPLVTGGALENPAYGQVRGLVTYALAFARPDEAMAIKTQAMQRAAKRLIGRGPFVGLMTASEYRTALSMAAAVFAVMRDEWGWKPKDLWDVQGFLWVTNNRAGNDSGRQDEEGENEVVQDKGTAGKPQPTNLILYGPPGTGKTFATAEHAVRLCDGVLPVGGREATMARYSELVARKRISFVTFHQTYAYEDFVEGLRPETGEDNESGGSAGFSLRAQPGVFRQIAGLALDNHRRAQPLKAFNRNRRVFKMSLGRSDSEEGGRLFRDAIKGGYVALGWGGVIDWSASEFDEFAAIKARWQQDHPDATGNAPDIQQLYALRGAMKPGDLVVISDGNKKFRAIGEVAGDYQFAPDDPGNYFHRRPVKWLWHNDVGQPRELIYGRSFSQVSAYQLDSEQINWLALEQIVAGGGDETEVAGEPEAYVLIIDEINRANVSKVFGELITLIEPDKRLGAPNELTVTLPYSGAVFGVPSNLHLIGTMNTADRSIALLDTALRRRFEFEELMPDPQALEDASVATGVDLVGVLAGLNARIEYLFDREHQIGHAFFMGCQSPADLSRVMRKKVIPLLAEYFYEDWEKVRLVLGESTDEGAFVGRVRLKPPTSMEQFLADAERWRYFIRADHPEHAFEQLKA